MTTSSNNRIIRVFISSTFSDMNNERNYLMVNVFPQLKEIARRRNVTFVELDLRWGIPDEDTHNGIVIQTCLDAIRDSKPFFIGIVGNRVGWCPSMEEIEKNPILLEQYPEIVDDIKSGYSVTEIEMQNAVLRNKEKMHAYFYFRNHREPLEGKIKQLRKKILNSGYPVSEYTTPEEFGEKVKRHFCELLDKLYPDTSISSSLYEHNTQLEIIHRLSSGFIDYNHIEDLVLSYEANNFSTKYWALVGDKGIGKSSFLAYWTEKNLNRFSIIPCFIGSTHLDSSISGIKEYLRKEINNLFDIPKTDNKTFEESLKQIPQKKYILFVIDGLENLNLKEEDIYIFLSTFTRYSQSCKVIFSLENKTKIKEQLHNLKAKYYEPKKLTEDRLEDLGCRYLSVFKKERFANKLQRIISSKICANPLLFKTILNELIAIGTNETINKLIDNYTSANSPEELYDKILTRFEKSYGKELVSNSFELIVNSPAGVTEAELTEILTPRMIEWSQFYYASAPFFSIINGSLYIDNIYLRRAIEKRYLEKKYWTQKKLISYFEDKLKNELELVANGEDAWSNRAFELLKTMLVRDESTITEYIGQVTNHPHLLGRINRYVSLLSKLLYDTGNYEILSGLISSPLCYLSLSVSDEPSLITYIQYLKLQTVGVKLKSLIDIQRYPLKIADLIYPEICMKVGRQLEEILHDSSTAITAYESAINYWDKRGESFVSDLYVIATYNYLLSLYSSLQDYKKIDSLYETIKKRFFSMNSWASEYKAGIVSSYIRSLEDRRLFSNIDNEYDLALSFISTIPIDNLKDDLKAQILHQRGNMYIERAVSENLSENTYNIFIERANNCLCESMDLFKKLEEINPYKYHNKYLEIRYDIANLHNDLGNNEMALHIYESIYTEFNSALAHQDYENFYTEDEIVLQTMYSLSFMYNDLGKYEQSEELLKKVLKMRKIQFLENKLLFSEEMAKCTYEMARLYGRMGKDIRLVESLYNKSIECYTLLSGKLPEIAKAYSSMGFAFQRVKMYKDAISYYTKSRETWQMCTENGYLAYEARLAEIYFQEAQCALACNDRECFGEFMIKSYDIYEKLSQIDPIHKKDLNRVAEYMQELLRINGLI